MRVRLTSFPVLYPMWFNYPKFYNMIASMPDMNRLVEVGCWKGESLVHLAKKLIEFQRPFELWGVDIWEKWQTPHASPKVLENVYDEYNAILIKAGVRDRIIDIAKPSVEAAKEFEDGSLDFVFIDADHRPASVLEDIKAWQPKVRRHGILAGHDYYFQTLGYAWCDDDNVAEAVNEAVRKRLMTQLTINTNTSVWMTYAHT